MELALPLPVVVVVVDVVSVGVSAGCDGEERRRWLATLASVGRANDGKCSAASLATAAK